MRVIRRSINGFPGSSRNDGTERFAAAEEARAGHVQESHTPEIDRAVGDGRTSEQFLDGHLDLRTRVEVNLSVDDESNVRATARCTDLHGLALRSRNVVLAPIRGALSPDSDPRQRMSRPP